MKTRPLGKDGYRVGEVGLGCWQFGGDFGDMAEETAISVMETSVASGVNFFDTANVYGAGRSENLIGRFLKERARPVTVATKYGRGDVYPHNYSADTLRRSVEGSLERIGVDRLDLLQLHCVPLEILKQAEIFDWLRQLKQEGLIKEFGASVQTVEEGLICMDQDELLSLQVIFNIFRQKLVAELLPAAKSRGVGIIVRLPLASGLLSGKFDKSTTFTQTDHRNYNRDGQVFSVGETFAGLPFETGVELVENVKALLPANMTMVQMALRWILDHEAVSVIIPGASSSGQASENSGVTDIPPLSDALHKTLSDVYWSLVHDRIRGPY